MPATLSILVVEDDEIIARNLAAAIEDRGCVLAGSAATVVDALAMLDVFSIDAAVLDASLLDRNVTPVAMALIEKTIPFVIFTGVGLPAELASVFPHVSVIMKPSDPDVVIAQLLDQVATLAGTSTNVTSSYDTNDRVAADAGQADKIASALFEQFGEKAVVLAHRQAKDARGDARDAWLKIIARLTTGAG